MTVPERVTFYKLVVDATLVELVRALQAEAIEPILLKGPATAQWLYPTDPERRPYGDVDVIVDPARWHDTQAVLRRLGFVELLGAESLRANEASTHADTWRRAEPLSGDVDLHRVPAQATVPPAVAWAALQPFRVPITVSGLTLDALSFEGRGMIAALHVTHHNGALEKPRRDLARAIPALDDDGWRRAFGLASELGCSVEFSGGLRAIPEGAALADRLGLEVPSWFDDDFAAGRRPKQKMAGAISLAQAEGVRAKASVLISELFPSRQFLEYQVPYARESRLGLVRAYARRPLALLATSPAAVRQYRLARAEQAGARSAAAPADAEPTLVWSIRDGVGARIARALWAARATRAARTQLRSGPLEAVRIPAPRGVPNGHSGIPRVLHMTRASCLERSLVRQAWAAAHGVRRDVVIGVTAPSDGFRAHAWLDGDSEDVSDFMEITRHPPR